jgi:hypothetical protein
MHPFTLSNCTKRRAHTSTIRKHASTCTDSCRVQEFAKEYQETYGGDYGWPDPDPDAIKFYEKVKARREKEKQEREE